MLTDHCAWPFNNDLAIEVMLARFPALRHGRDYLIANPCDEKTHAPTGAPFFMAWYVADMAPPNMAELADEFAANESHYRAALARRYRNMMLTWSDTKVQFPVDAPVSLTRANTPWLVWRQALRDLPQQPGFPYQIAWPECPGQQPQGDSDGTHDEIG
jgi:hypothetical protein